MSSDTGSGDDKDNNNPPVQHPEKVNAVDGVESETVAPGTREEILDLEAMSTSPIQPLKGCNVFVASLPSNYDDAALRELFEPHGEIVSAKVSSDLVTGNSKLFGFVLYEKPASAQKAIAALNGIRLVEGSFSKLHVSFAMHDEKTNAGESDILYVRNLPYFVVSENLHSVFSAYGTVLEATVLPGNRTGGILPVVTVGFVRMQTVEEAKAAIAACNGSKIFGPSPILVRFKESSNMKLDRRVKMVQNQPHLLARFPGSGPPPPVPSYILHPGASGAPRQIGVKGSMYDVSNPMVGSVDTYNPDQKRNKMKCKDFKKTSKHPISHLSHPCSIDQLRGGYQHPTQCPQQQGGQQTHMGESLQNNVTAPSMTSQGILSPTAMGVMTPTHAMQLPTAGNTVNSPSLHHNAINNAVNESGIQSHTMFDMSMVGRGNFQQNTNKVPVGLGAPNTLMNAIPSVDTKGNLTPSGQSSGYPITNPAGVTKELMHWTQPTNPLSLNDNDSMTSSSKSACPLSNGTPMVVTAAAPSDQPNQHLHPSLPSFFFNPAFVDAPSPRESIGTHNSPTLFSVSSDSGTNGGYVVSPFSQATNSSMLTVGSNSAAVGSMQFSSTAPSSTLTSFRGTPTIWGNHYMSQRSKSATSTGGSLNINSPEFHCPTTWGNHYMSQNAMGTTTTGGTININSSDFPCKGDIVIRGVASTDILWFVFEQHLQLAIDKYIMQGNVYYVRLKDPSAHERAASTLNGSELSDGNYVSAITL